MIGTFRHHLLMYMLRRSCPDTIPRSGEKGMRVRCFSVYLKGTDDDWLLLVKSMGPSEFQGLLWNGTRFEKSGSISFSDVEPRSIHIERYVGLFTFTYTGVVRCILNDWTFINRLPILREGLAQFLFDRKDLGLTERVETIQALVQASIDDPNFRVTEVSLPALLHGHRWILHRDRKRQQAYARHLLASFEDSGEVKKDQNGAYAITGKALTSLSRYQTEKQRHDQMLAQSRHMKWLTLALILVGLASVFVTYLASNE